jgi:hypothetical protein
VTRADALQALIDKVAEDKGSPSSAATRQALGRKDATHLFWDVLNNGSLNAVARLEAPLRERGWNITLWNADGEWFVKHTTPTDFAVAKAPTEPRARLLAVLRALAWEAKVEVPA